MPRCDYFSDNLVWRDHLRDVTQGVRALVELELELGHKCSSKCPLCQLVFGHVVVPCLFQCLSKASFIFNS